MTSNLPFAWLVLVGVSMPALVFALLAAASLLNRPLPERWTGAITASAMTVSCLAFATALVVHGIAQTGTRLLSYGEWSTTRADGIGIEFLVDRWALGFAAGSAAHAGRVSGGWNS